MELTDYVRRYISEKSLSDGYIESLQTTARQLTSFVGGSLLLAHLDAQRVNEWLQSIEPDGALTARNKKIMVGVLWRAAHDAGLAPPVGKLRSIKVKLKSPEAPTIEQVAALIRAADNLRGFFQGTAVPRRTYWKSIIMAGWDTALRLSDLRSIERDWIQNGCVVIVQNKTGNCHRVKLRPETMEQIDLLRGGCPKGPIWSVLNKKNFGRAFKQLAISADVQVTFKRIRKASASYVEAACPGTAWRHLGHRRPGLDVQFYIDPRIASPEPTQPPSLKLT